MPYCKTEALVIDKSNYRETSQIVTCFTRAYGKVRLLAKGAKRPRNSFEGPLDLLQYLRITYIDKTNSRPGYSSGLSLLIDSKIQDGFPALRENLQRFYQANYIAEFLDELTPEAEKHPELFDAALNTLKELTMRTTHSTNNLELFSFETRAIKQLGYMPHTKSCAQCSGKVTPGIGKTVLFSNQAGGVLCQTCAARPQYNNQNITTNLSVLSLFYNLANSVTSSLNRIKISEDTTRELRQLLNYYIACIAGKELKTFSYLQ